VAWAPSAEVRTEPPTSLLDGVEAAVCEVLRFRSLRHKSALLDLCPRDDIPRGAVAAAFAVIAENRRRCAAAGIVSRSTENWRWRAPKLDIAPANASPEVRLERALIGACACAGRADWSNQVPVASGVAGPSRERRRAIDLVRQAAPGHFELIELKVASDTPLYAAVEIIGYTAIWLLSRAGGAGGNPLLAAGRIDAKVLAPEAYYARFDLHRLARVFQEEVAALGSAHGVALDFGFETFPDAWAVPPPTDENMLRLATERRPV
jgi:hypothetical protein